ncbi:hypothetical protein R5R35_014810 [Gryllus longicercus]
MLPPEERPVLAAGSAVGGGSACAGADEGAAGGPLAEAERAITRHFAMAHGLLQLQEAALLERLAAAGSAAEQTARAALRDLSAAAERTRALLVEASRVAGAGQLKWGDLRELTRQLLDTRHERCRVVLSPSDVPRCNFTVDPEFTSFLARHCRLDLVAASVPALEPMGDSPPTASIPIVPTLSELQSTLEVDAGSAGDTATPDEKILESTEHPKAGCAESVAKSPVVHPFDAAGNNTLPTPSLDDSSNPESASVMGVTVRSVAAAAAAALSSYKGEPPDLTPKVPVNSAATTSPMSNSSTSSRPANVPHRRAPRGRPGKQGRGSAVHSSNNYRQTSGSRHVNARAAATSGAAMDGVRTPASLPDVSAGAPAQPLEADGPPVISVPCSISKENPPPKPFVAVGKPEVVHVVHVKSPSSFYVHRDQDRSILEDLQKFLDACPERDFSPPNLVQIGQMYICKFLVDDKWYRVTVKDFTAMLNPPESRDAIVDVFYVDYGNSDRVQLSRLRPLPAEVADVPPYALHCSIFDLHPREGNAWSNDAHRTFCKMVNGVRVHMNVMSFSDDVYYIDLCAIPGMKHCNFPVSVRDAMVFMDLAYLEDESRLNIRLASARFDSEYLKEEPLSKSENFPVVLSHIDSPSRFYAQRRGTHAEYLTNLLDDMSRYYKENKDDMIYDPGVGMPCAAQFSLDKGWYRARVLSIPRKSWVEVFYVDYGNREEVPYTSIRKMPEKFMRIPPQAIECALADVMPTKGNKWLKSATEFFLNSTKDKELRLLIDNVSKQCTKVILYEEKENVDICLNALLVREGHALSIGVGASLVQYIKVEAALPPDAKQEQTPLFQAIKPTRKKVRKMRKTDRGGVGVLEANEYLPATDPSKVTTFRDANSGPPCSMAVTVVAINSPGHFFVRPCIIEEEIANLIQDMQTFYSGKTVTKTEWQLQDKCSVLSVKEKRWYRGIIVEIIDNKVKVFYKDIAGTEVVPFHNLRVLHESFVNIHNGSLRCHMFGIQAAGGQKWSSTACEMLSDLVYKTYSELFITKKGEIEENSLPVELWARDVVSPGPLEPNRIDWIALNRVLIEKGMAIPTTMPASLEILQTGLPSETARFESTVSINELNVPEEEDTSSSESEDIFEEDDSGRRELFLFPENPRNQWLPALPLKKHRFIGMTTHVDVKCRIYMHNVEDNESLKVIKDACTKFVGDSKPKPQDMYWFEGQMCLVQFFADTCWYRGKIMAVKENNMYEVLFVDYGNIELCGVEMLRKDLIVTHIPILCRAFQLDEIQAADCEGLWKLEHLDFLHMTLDGKNCQVCIKTALDDPVPKVSLTLPGNIDVAQLLVSMHYAIYSSNVLGNSEELNTSSEESVIIEKEEILDLNDSNMEGELMRLENVVNLAELSNADISVEVNVEKNKNYSKSNEKLSNVEHPEEAKDVDKNVCELECELKVREEPVISDFNKRKDFVNELNVEDLSKNKVLKKEKCLETIVNEVVQTVDNCKLESFSDINKIKQVYEEKIFTKENDESDKNFDCTRITEMKLTKCEEKLVQDAASSIPHCSESVNVLNEDEKRSLSYKRMTLENCNFLTVQVTTLMDSLTEIVMIPERDKNERIVCRDDFDLMTLQIQNEAPLQSPLKMPYVGQPCCAQYFEDEQYYRAIVVEIGKDNEKLKVEFVDYGNLEWIDVKWVRKIKPEWMELPIQGIKCSLWNVKIAEDCEKKVLLKRLSKLIFDISLTAKIKKKDPLAVELYYCNSENLVYQALLDASLLVEINEDKATGVQGNWQ